MFNLSSANTFNSVTSKILSLVIGLIWESLENATVSSSIHSILPLIFLSAIMCIWSAWGKDMRQGHSVKPRSRNMSLKPFSTQSRLLTTLKIKLFGNIVGKGENAGNQHFLHFLQYLLPFPEQISSFQSHLFCRLHMLSICLKFCGLVKS